MKKIILLIVVLVFATTTNAQRKQTIGYIDMEYILENIPEYLKAQNILDSKVARWRKKLDEQTRYIEVLKTDLTNEKAILTKDLIEEKEEEITIKQIELRRLESLYFGSNGNLFQVRKQLVKPIQDQVYNAIQSIAKRKKFDFIFDKTSDLVMLYSNKKYDISDIVLATITKNRLKNQKQKLKEGKSNPNRELSEAEKEKKTILESAQAKKITAQELKRKALAKRKQQLLEQRAERKKLLEEKKAALQKKKEDAKRKREEAN